MNTYVVPKLRYGSDLLRKIKPELFDNCVVFCAPEPWELVRDQFGGEPLETAVPESMEQSVIEAQIRSMPEAKTVFGIGGGSACDAAKMYAWLRGARLLLVPSIISADAPFTKAVGLRVGHRVRYVGEVFPEAILVDFDLLQKAPKRLNRAGAGDVLSIHTALFDWRLARDATHEKFDEGVAARSEKLLDRLVEGAGRIRDCNEEGLRLICELYIAEVELCERWGNSRPEEGSEHYFAYCLESITRRNFIHGELVSIGVILGSLFQEQPVGRVINFLNETGVEYRPSKVGMTCEEIRRTLLKMPEYLEEETQLLFGIYHHKGMTENRADDLIAAFLSAIGE